MVYQKEFDLIGYIFYPNYQGVFGFFDLTDAPYWVSFSLGLVFVLVPISYLFKAYISGDLEFLKECFLKKH